MDRHHFQGSENTGGRNSDFTHGDYFSAVRRFFEDHGFSILSDAFGPESCPNPTDIDICLMKHGECYHPAKVTVTISGHRRSFVLNVAVSDPGLRIIDAEIEALKRLGGLPGPSFIPGLYGQGSVSLHGEPAVRMFLGEWFDGYHEFHLTEGGPRSMIVWGEQDAPFTLSREEAYLLYHQAASILTRYYNPATTEQISRWHHAAGDFVVRCRDSRVDVRLITVRQYSPMLKMDAGPAGSTHRGEQALDALLIFLIGLSIRMRLDRMDGIGKMTWADDTAVVGTWSGFLEGLSENCFPSAILPDPVERFESRLAAYGRADILALAESIANALPVSPTEKALIEKFLPSHVETLLETISRIGFP